MGKPKSHAAEYDGSFGSWGAIARQGCLWLAASLALLMPCQANDIVSAYVLNGRPEQQFHEELELQAMQKVETARIACGLTPEQTETLRQCALGDVNRATQELAVLRRATEDLNITDQQQMQKGYALVQPFIARLHGDLHGKGSLFAKYLEHTLDDSQKEHYQQYLAEKEKKRQHLLVLHTVASIEQRVPLLKTQREKLIELIESRPAPKIKRSENAIGYLRLALVPEGELNQILDEQQTKEIVKICEPYRAFQWAAP